MSTPEYEELEADFGEVIDILRGGLPESPSERPSESVWDAIASELELPGRVAPTARLADPEVAAGGPSANGAVVRDISSARSWGRRGAIFTAVAAALLLVAVPVGLAIGGDGDPDRRAELLAMSDFAGSGEAELDGRDLNVRFDGDAAPDGSFYELWLLDLDGGEVARLESLGQIEVAADGTYQVPDGIDLDEYDVVDVSVEPDDGNPEHSGVSVLRGDLTEI